MIDLIKEWITLGLIFPIVVIFGGFLTVRLGFVQIVKLKKAISLVTLQERQGGLSSFGAMAAILGGNLGTGNISGVAVAMMTGGPGALLWMWLMALLASTTKYVGCFLGVHFQRQNLAGEWVGGPMFYLGEGLKSRALANLFCIFTITSALTVGNLVQVHALSLPIKDLNLNPLIFGIVMAMLVGGVIFGSLKSFSSIVSALVPIMAVAYIATCFIVLIIFRHNIIPSIELILSSAIGVTPMAGGAAGFTMTSAIRAGFDRGLFATDSGLGLAPILHGAVRDPSPDYDNRHHQALISVLSPMVVMIVCSMTGLVLLSTQAIDKSYLSSTNMCMEAFRIGFSSLWAGHIVSITLFFFAFTTILTWSFCANRAVEYLAGPRLVNVFKIIFIALIPVGVYAHEHLVWLVADFSTNLMFLSNMIGLIALTGLVLKARSL